jgi:hypothetical protein
MRKVLPIVLVAACGSTTPAPAPAAPPAAVTSAPAPAGPVPLDQNLPVLATRATQLYQSVAKLLVTNTECDKATDRLVELQAANADVVAANNKVLHEGRAKDLRAALESHAADLDAAAKDIVGAPLMRACSQDRAFTDAFDSLVGAPP